MEHIWVPVEGVSLFLEPRQQPKTPHPFFPEDWALHYRGPLLSLKGPEETTNGPGVGTDVGM